MMKIKAKPEGVFWSDEQWQAIAARGQNMLVAAAAGSGKTAVLVERIIRKITEDRVDVDRLLVMTFTNAAAAEMKTRVGKALEAELAKQPSSLHLRRQLSLLNRAQVSTIHSFCMNVLRRYYYRIGIDPAFRVVDDTEAQLMRQEICEELFEEEYGKEGNAGFYELVDRYTGDRNDSELQALVEKLYDFSRSHPQPDQWLDDMADAYAFGDDAQIEDLPWTKEVLADVQMQLEGLRDMLVRAERTAGEPGGPAAYQETLAEDLRQLETLMEAAKTSWGRLYEAFQALAFSKLKSVRGEHDEALKKSAKALRDDVKKQAEKIRAELFAREPEQLVEDLRDMAPHVRTLAELVKAFAARYKQAKLAKGLIDFDDSQHYCLEVLSEEDGAPATPAIEYREQFEEVLVDEYQDTNFVQEAILQLITKADNLFMVGDVKQSIYRFRQAEPGLFLSKYGAFTKDGSDPGLRIDLAKNFRSRAEVLSAVNFLFRQIMNPRVGEIAYDEDAELKFGFTDYPAVASTEPELVLIDREGEITGDEETDEDTDDLKSEQLEARWIAGKIEQLISERYEVFDKDTGNMRPVTYRDMVILMRSAATAAPILLDEFKQRGIPAYAEISTGYFEAVEVEVMMSLLKMIDNPLQDIPAAGVLRSPIVGLNGEQLAQIRIKQPKGNFYKAMKAYMEDEQDELAVKLQAFHDRLDSWRNRARRGALSELIWQIYRETGYYDWVGGLAGGRQRQANLRALYDRARQYEKTSFRGLFRFLRFIERMRDRGSDFGAAKALSEQEDVVRVMTIHKSKGLEYPVVFAANLNKQFNFSDSRGRFMLDKELGFATKRIDPEKRISYPTLSMFAAKRKAEMEMLAEEMRVLYVALTRAREKLYLVATDKKTQKTLTSWAQVNAHPEWLLPDFLRANAKTFLDWIGPAVIRHRAGKTLLDLLGEPHHAMAEVASDASTWLLSVVPAGQLAVAESERVHDRAETEQLIRLREPVPVESGYKEQVHERLSWGYSWMKSVNRMAKQTVSEIKRQREHFTNVECSDTSLIRSFRSSIAERPKFMQATTLTASEKGTAMHTVMQHLDLRQAITDEHVRATIDRLVADEIMTEGEAGVVDIAAIVQFFETDLGQRVLQAEQIEREVPFSFAIPAAEAYGDAEEGNELVLIQGVIDCLLTEPDGMVLIDYKSDAIERKFTNGFQEAKSVLADRYRLQLDMYAKAIQQIRQMPLKDQYLYFFDGGHLLQM